MDAKNEAMVVISVKIPESLYKFAMEKNINISHLTVEALAEARDDARIDEVSG